MGNEPEQSGVPAAVIEFNRLANALAMPGSERRSILGLPPVPADLWHVNDISAPAPVSPEFVRRLDYVLPLMRRMVANQPAARLVG